MKKFSKDNIPKPASSEEDSVEIKIHKMMDISEPDAPEPATDLVDEAVKPTEPEVVKKINVLHHDDGIPSAPELPGKKKAKSKKIKVNHESTDTDANPDINDLIADTNHRLEQQAETLAEESPAPEGNEGTFVKEPVAPEEVTNPEPEADLNDSNLISPLDQTINSESTDKAVGEIVASESDELLAVQDQKNGTKQAVKISNNKPRRKWSRFWWILIFSILIAGLAVMAFPSTRYKTLNTLGVRAGASLKVYDRKSLRPIRDAKVTIGGVEAKTNKDGLAKLDGLMLGPTKIQIDKRAYKATEKNEVLGWGSNPLADVQLEPTGLQTKFIVTDELSGKPIENAEISFGEFNTMSDNKGEASLNTDSHSGDALKVTIKANGYRTTEVEAQTNGRSVTVKLALERAVAFISKKSGAYDVYSVNSDGSDEKLVLKGTGSEPGNITLLQSPSDNIAMLRTNRSGDNDKTGALLAELYSVDLSTGKATMITQGSTIEPIGWAGKRFIYTISKVDSASDDSSREKLMSYSYKPNDNRQLASSNHFNDVVLVGTTVYYAPQNSNQDGINIGLFKVDSGGGDKQSVFDKEVWRIVRTEYNKLALAVQQDWFSYSVKDKSANKLIGQEVNTQGRQYLDSPDGKTSVWAETRGKTTLLHLFDVNSEKDTLLTSLEGGATDVIWLNSNVLAYSSSLDNTPARFVLSTNGGTSRKLSNRLIVMTATF